MTGWRPGLFVMGIGTDLNPGIPGRITTALRGTRRDDFFAGSSSGIRQRSACRFRKLASAIGSFSDERSAIDWLADF